jgi:hypothetical protein
VRWARVLTESAIATSPAWSFGGLTLARACSAGVLMLGVEKEPDRCDGAVGMTLQCGELDRSSATADYRRQKSARQNQTAMEELHGYGQRHLWQDILMLLDN